MDSANQQSNPYALVVMGVSGCGKSSVAQLLGKALGWAVCEGDAYHPASNISKMQTGIALTDEDRQGWLKDLAVLLSQATPQAGMVLTCSALRQRYRDRLRAAVPGLRFVFLSLTQDQARERVAARPGHLFPVSLVASQFETLEDPSNEAGVLRVDATRPLAELGAEVQQWLQAALVVAEPTPAPATHSSQEA